MVDDIVKLPLFSFIFMRLTLCCQQTFGEVFTDFLLGHLHKANNPKDFGDVWKKFFALLTRVFALVEGDACMMVTF